MPVKRRLPKTRATRPEAPLDAWATFFAFGRDYFNDLGPYGIDVSDRATVEAAWAHYGHAYLAHWPVLRQTYFPGESVDADGQPWALTALGDPR